eukprot:COSAG01_NODE_1902_length_8963_cov_29.997405_1_plen_350_part_00
MHSRSGREDGSELWSVSTRQLGPHGALALQQRAQAATREKQAAEAALQQLQREKATRDWKQASKREKALAVQAEEAAKARLSAACSSLDMALTLQEEATEPPQEDDEAAAAAAAVGSRPMGKAERRQAEREARSRAKQAGRRRARAKFRRRPPAACRTVCSTALKAGSLRKKLASLENCECHHRPLASVLEGDVRSGRGEPMRGAGERLCNGCVTVGCDGPRWMHRRAADIEMLTGIDLDRDGDVGVLDSRDAGVVLMGGEDVEGCALVAALDGSSGEVLWEWANAASNNASRVRRVSTGGHLLRVRVAEIMGPGNYENVGKSQLALIMINPIIFTRTRSRKPQSERER